MSSYDFYNKNKKTKLFSWKTFAKIVGVILACFVGAFGLLVLGLYLAGEFDPDKIPPDGIKFKIEEADASKFQPINGVDYYIPDLTLTESGEYVLQYVF